MRFPKELPPPTPLHLEEALRQFSMAMEPVFKLLRPSGRRQHHTEAPLRLRYRGVEAHISAVKIVSSRSGPMLTMASGVWQKSVTNSK